MPHQYLLQGPALFPVSAPSCTQQGPWSSPLYRPTHPRPTLPFTLPHLLHLLEHVEHLGRCYQLVAINVKHGHQVLNLRVKKEGAQF